MNRSLLNSLLAFLRICVPRSAETSLMSCNKATNHFVFPNVGNSFLVALSSPRSRIQLWPIDLPSSATYRKEMVRLLTYSIPFLIMKFAHQAATANQNKIKILMGKTAASGSLLVKEPMKTKNRLKAKM